MSALTLTERQHLRQGMAIEFAKVMLASKFWSAKAVNAVHLTKTAPDDTAMDLMARASVEMANFLLMALDRYRDDP